MDLPLEILAPIAAIIIITLAMGAAVFGMETVRRHDYRRFEDRSAATLARQFPLPEVESSIAEQRREFLSPFVEVIHKSASAAQTKYYSAVVCSAGCLGLAFSALAFGPLTREVMGDRPIAEAMLNYIDVIAVYLVLVLFLYGQRASQPWIASRAGTELMRQFQFLEIAFPNLLTPGTAGDMKKRCDREIDHIVKNVQRGKFAELVARIERFWSARKTLLAGGPLSEADLTPDAVLVYLNKRVLRQLGWFNDSKDRLEYIAKRRQMVLKCLYLLTALLAAIKFAFFITGNDLHHYLLPFLLTVAGISAAMTAHYISQNSRSLIHRYNSQSRFIAGWLTAFNEVWRFDRLASLTLDATTKNDIRGRIFVFEDLMIDELIDWIHITGHDAIELAP